MNSNLNRLEAKVDKLDERLDRIDLHLAQYNQQLEIHIEGVRITNKRLDHEMEKFQAQVEPLKAWADSQITVINFAAKAGKVLAWGVSIAAGLLGLLKLLA